MPKLYWDSETRSKCDLRLCGGWRYANHSSTEPLFVCWAVDDGKVATWVSGDPVPEPFIAAAAAPAEWQVIAHNYDFERFILERVLTPQFGFPAIAAESWHCSQRLALANAYPAELGLLAQALELPYRKDPKAARALRDVFRMRGGEWNEDPEKLALVQQRCELDVVTMRACWQHPKLKPLNEIERRYQLLDATINRRGIRIDQEFVLAARTLATTERNAINTRLCDLSSGAITSVDQVQRLRELVNAHGHTMTTLGKRSVSAVLAREPDEFVRELLELRRAGARAAVRKFERILAYADQHDDRLRGCLRIYGAGPGRWSSLGPQLQNLKKNESNLPLSVVDAIRRGDRGHVAQFGNPLALIGDVSRAMLCAKPDHVLMAADFSTIESRILAWLAGESWKLKSYREFDRTGNKALDLYRVLAGKMLGKPAAEIDDKERQQGKGAELAAGFGGGPGAWRRIFPDEERPDHEIKKDIARWRRMHPRIRRFWKRLERAVHLSFRAGVPIRVNEPPLPEIFTRFADGNLTITLPSGRNITYPNARLVPGKYEDPDVSFYDNAHGQWRETRAWFGLLVENVVQGTARDLLAAALERLEARGLAVCFHCHDEAVAEVPIGTITESEFLAIMLQAPSWADGLPLAGTVFSGPHYLEAPDKPAAPLPAPDPVDAYVDEAQAEIEHTHAAAREFERNDAQDYLDNLSDTDAPLYALTSLPLTAGNKTSCPFHDDPMPSCQLYADHFHCFGCGAHGDRICWLMEVEGFTRAEAKKLICDYDGSAPKPVVSTVDKTERALELWNAAGALIGSIAERYLAETRAIDVSKLPAEINDSLRFHPRCPFGPGIQHPCLLALMRDAETDAPTGIHRIALRNGGDKIEKIDRMTLGSVGAVKLWPAADRLIIGEGLETVLAAATRIPYQGLPLQPAWSVISDGGLKRFPVLSDVQHLIVLVDNDVNGVGQAAGDQCELRWKQAGRGVTQLIPEQAGWDFNDIVLGGRT
jgi:DNA polymerase